MGPKVAVSFPTMLSPGGRGGSLRGRTASFTPSSSALSGRFFFFFAKNRPKNIVLILFPKQLVPFAIELGETEAHMARTVETVGKEAAGRFVCS